MCKICLLNFLLIFAFFETVENLPFKPATTTKSPYTFKFVKTDINTNKIEDYVIEKSLEEFLDMYYEKYVKEDSEKKLVQKPTEESEDDIYEKMLGDEPVEIKPNTEINNLNITQEEPSEDYIKAMRDRFNRDTNVETRSKDNWIQILKDNILRQIGRNNMTSQPIPPLNFSGFIPTVMNTSIIDEEHIIEKIRSFYPSCEVPQATEEMWKDDNSMNLFFNFDHTTDEKSTKIATATLRLYRVPLDNSTKSGAKASDCDNSGAADEEKLIRVTTYWYTTSLKKKRGKKRICDSKVVPESSSWVEFNVKQATKAWSKGKNMGLAISVEDQDGNTLKTDKFFKGPTCMVGMSTPKPIPTIIVDAVRKTDPNRLNALSGNDTSSALYSDLQLLPTIDICTLESPENHTLLLNATGDLRINACNLKLIYEQSQKMAEKEHLERIITLPLPSNRHIRHQKQHLANKNLNLDQSFDPRSSMMNSRIVFTNEELQTRLNSTTS